MVAWLGIGLGLDQAWGLGPLVPKSPEAAVAALGPRAILDPSDTTSMRVGRDGTGNAPAADANVGLILDKSEMAGATAADFIAEQTEGVPSTVFTYWSDPTEPDGWAKTGTHNAQNFVEQSGGLRLVGDGTAVGLRLPASLSAGAWYRYEIDVTITSGSVEVEQRSDVASLTTERTISATGTVEGFIYGAGTATSLGLSLSVASDVTVNSLSLKAVPGRHFVALSDALRPTLRTGAGLQYLEIATDHGMATEGDETVDAGFFTCVELRYPVYDGPGSPERVFGISNSVKSHRQYEPHRVCRRLQLLSRMEPYEQDDEQIFA